MSALECGCKSRLENQLAERYAEANPGSTEVAASLDGYGFGIAGNRMVLRGVMPVAYSAEVTNKAGITKRKRVKGNMVFSFCPFCGEKGAA